MHILILPSWYPSNPKDVTGSFFREQAQALVHEGCQVGVIYPQLRSIRRWRTIWSGAYGSCFEQDANIPTIRYHDMGWFPRMPRLQAMQWVARGRSLYADYVKRFGKPDLIHAHSLLYAGCLAKELSISEAIPYVVTEHSSAFAMNKIGAKRMGMAKYAADGAQRKFAVSKQLCALLDKHLGCTEPKWLYMPNMVRDGFLRAPIVKNSIDNRFVFLHVSLLDANKAVDNIIKAFAKEFSGDDRFLLKIGGNGRERELLEALAIHLGVSRQIEFLGALSRDEVESQMQKCDAFVLSSRYETFGVVLIESLAMGKPVIATRCGGSESIVREQDGLLVPVDDVVSLSKAMRYMWADYARYDSFNIRAACASRFSAHAVTTSLIEKYNEICSDYSCRRLLGQ